MPDVTRGWSADEALEVLYVAHWRQLVRLAVMLLHDQGAAEEVVQDSFVAMHSKWGRLHDPDKALAYLRQSVVNRSRSHLRHLSVVRRHAEREASPGARGRRRPHGVRRRAARHRARRPAGSPPPPARGAGPALLPRSLGGRDRRRPRDQPRCGQEPRVPGRRRAPGRPGPHTRGDPMNDDDDQLRRLLSDAVSDVEPRDRIAEIRASVHPDPQVVPMSRPRPWLYALSGAVASAAVIGVIAYTTTALSGPDDGSNGLGAGQAHTRHSRARPSARRPRPTPRRRPPRPPRPRRHLRQPPPAPRRTPCTTSAPTRPGGRCSTASGIADRTCRRPTQVARAATC